MYYLIYTSYELTPFTEDGLQKLLRQSRADNLDLGITGFLYYYRHSFIQLIEGSKENVKLLYERIRADNRHHRLVILKEGEVVNRYFPDWTMGYQFIKQGDELANSLDPSDSGVIDKSAVLYLFKIIEGTA